MNQSAMSEFERLYAGDTDPLCYSILTSGKPLGDDWKRISDIVTPDYVFFPGGDVAIYSAGYTGRLTPGTGLMELRCLSCFFHILRAGMGQRYALLDDHFRLRIRPFRAPCETTAVYGKGYEIYYMEGCGRLGIYWRSGSRLPVSEPPFVSCGAFDANAGCWGGDCPRGAYVDDSDEPFRFSG